MRPLILICLLAGTVFLGAQSTRHPNIEFTDVAVALYVTDWEVEKEIVVRPLALPPSLRTGVPESGLMTAADRALGTRLIDVHPTSGQIDAGVMLATKLRNAPQPPPGPEITRGRTPWLLLLGIAGPAVFLMFYQRWKSAITLGILGAIIWTFTSRKPGAEPISPDQAAEITDSILKNVYHAFNISDENAQYDQLKTVLDGPALESTFLEVRRTTNQRSEDGSRVRVRDVTVLRTGPKQNPGELEFTTSCQWETSGEIGHWGHFHDRKNFYSADISLAVIDGKWKATEINLNSRERE